MIIDKIENSEIYERLHLRFAKAFAFICKTDFSKLDDGKYEIENDDIFAIVQEYNTKDKKDLFTLLLEKTNTYASLLVAGLNTKSNTFYGPVQKTAFEDLL